MSETVATQSEDGTSLQVRVGDIVVVRLPETPTTGYRWAVVESDDAILGPQSTDFVQGAGAGIGGGGVRTFRFQAKSAGATELQLKRWREWEGDRSITQRYRLTVHVLPA
jgi:inhibitor of cysteine peptidase